MKSAALSLLLLVSVPAFADPKCSWLRPCDDVAFASNPVGATVTVTEKGEVRTCIAPCSLSVREGDTLTLEAKLEGYTLTAKPSIKWVYKYHWNSNHGYSLEPQPITFGFAK